MEVCPPPRCLRPKETARQEDRPADWPDSQIRIAAERAESDGRAGGVEKQSDQALARGRAGTTTFTRRAESQHARYTLRYDSHGHARRVSGVGLGCVNIDNYFFGLRP